MAYVKLLPGLHKSPVVPAEDTEVGSAFPADKRADCHNLHLVTVFSVALGSWLDPRRQDSGW